VDIDVRAPEFRAIAGDGAPMDLIAHGLQFGEGPVWDRRTGWLYWVDIIGSAIWRWKAGSGREVVMKPSGHANGMTFDHEGRLTVAGWCNRTVFRFEHDGSLTTMASTHDGKKFNSPNDIVVRSDRSVWWTDSAGGLGIPGMVAEDVQRYLDVQGVYRLAPDGRTVQLVIPDITYPNGLAFSPDESLLYVNDTRAALIHVYDVRPDGSVANGRVFHRMTGSEPGVADGMKVDVQGNVYCTGPGGVHVIEPSGRLLGRIRIPGHATNMCWGDADWKTLYITSYSSLYRTRLGIPGVAVW
jgi:sugar lactone lactonase YvrE